MRVQEINSLIFFEDLFMVFRSYGHGFLDVFKGLLD